MTDYNLKLVSVDGATSTIEITYPDASKKTMKIDGLPVAAEKAPEYVAAAKKYMEDLLRGEAQVTAVTPSATVTALVGKSTTISI